MGIGRVFGVKGYKGVGEMKKVSRKTLCVEK